MKKIILLALLILPFTLLSQSKWKKPEVKDAYFTLFKSPQAFTLHTAEVVPKGDIFYGISHRFNGSFNDHFNNFFGMDNGANMRTKLGYGLTDNFMATIGRTGRGSANEAMAIYDLELKYKLFKSKDALPLPIIVSAMGVVSYTSDIAFENELETMNQMQYVGQIMINTMLFDRIAIGVNPTYLHNSCMSCIDETKSSIIMGSYLQWYIGDDMTSFVIEANNTISGFRGDGERRYYDSYAFGVELETGGHFFKVLLGNNTNLNQTQYLLGSVNQFDISDMRLGFQITRNF